jgi:hypothetical protein
MTPHANHHQDGEVEVQDEHIKVDHMVKLLSI